MKNKNIEPLLQNKLDEIQKIKEKRKSGLLSESESEEQIKKLKNEHTLIIIDHVLDN